MATLEKTPPIVAALPIRNVRAVVFLNSPGRYFEKQLLPKMAEFRVDVERYVFMDKSKSFDVSGLVVDVFIALVDLMDHKQFTRVRELSKKHNVRFLGLSRSGDWSERLSTVPRRPLPPPTPKNVVVPFRQPLPKEPELTDSERELPSSSPLSLDDVEEFLALYQKENDELVEENKALTRTVSAREDAILTALAKEEEVRKEKALLDKRLKDQIEIRAQVEGELRVAKEALDALALQLRTRTTPTMALPAPTVVKDNPGSVAAMKAHNTRLKNDLEVSRRAQVETAKELEALRIRLTALQDQKQPLAAAEVLVNKDDLISWGNAIRDVVTGHPAGYRALLELAHRYNIDIKALLEQIS